MSTQLVISKPEIIEGLKISEATYLIRVLANEQDEKLSLVLSYVELEHLSDVINELKEKHSKWD